MAENEQDQTGTEQGTENQEAVTETQEAPALLTQEQFDAALSERLNQVREQSAADLKALRENAEATIAGYQRAAQQFQRAPVQDEDDPKPANMTKDQEIMWDANKPNRIWTKAQNAKLRSEFSQTVNPILQDSTVTRFFQGKTGVPESVKAQAIKYFAEVAGESSSLNPEQVMHASYIRACAAHAESQFNGTVASTGKAVVKPQPKVVAPNGSADMGGGTRQLGMGRVGTANMTWQQIRDDLIAKNKFPEDPI